MSVSRVYTFGEVLKQFRVRTGLSQQRLAEALHLHRNTISNWECGNDLPKTRPIVLTIAEALNLDEHDTNILLSASFHEQLNEPLWNVPHQRNPYFTGREDLLAYLHQQFTGGAVIALSQAQAISGLGGIGKTQTVIEYAYRYRDDYRAVLWVKADSRENLLADFAALASLLKLPERDAPDQMIAINAVKRWLQEQTNWLLIVDNADALSVVKELLAPGYRGHILLTTRAQAMGGLVQRVEIETMLSEEGTLFLLRRAGLIRAQTSFAEIPTAYREVALEVMHELDGLPLALDQAGAYMEESSCHPADYLRLYRQQRTALLSRRGGLTGDHPEPVTTTWALSFQQVEQADPLAADLLRLCAFLDPDAIPEEVLIEGAKAAPLDPLRVNDALAVLLRFSLIRRNAETRTLTIHRLVQAVIQESMDRETQSDWAMKAICAVNHTFPDLVTVETWMLCQRCLPHIQACLILAEAYSLILPETAVLFNQAGYYLRERGLYIEAESIFQKALLIREQMLGADHPDTAQVLYNLARLYFEMGKYSICEMFHLRALAVREQMLSPNDLSIALSLNSLAFTYYIQGIKYDEAEVLFHRALRIFDQVIGRDHPKTSHCLSNLALLYTTQGKYNEAENLLVHVQAIRDNYLGPTHLDTARSLQNLAWLYIDQEKQERYEEAERLLEQALAIRESLLGPEHPQIATSLHHLALLFEAQGKYNEATQLYERVLIIRRKMLGKDNPKVLLTEEQYAALLKKVGHTKLQT